MNVTVLACFALALSGPGPQDSRLNKPFQFYVRLGQSHQLEVVARYGASDTKVIYQRKIDPAEPYLGASLKLAIDPTRKVLLLPSLVEQEGKGCSVILREISYSGKLLSTKTVKCYSKEGSSNRVYAGFDDKGHATVVWNTASQVWYENENSIGSSFKKLPQNIYEPGKPGALISSDQWCDLVSPIFDSTIEGRLPSDKIFDLVKGFKWSGELTDDSFSWKADDQRGTLKLARRDEAAVAVKIRTFPYVTVIFRAPTYRDQARLETDYVPRAYKYQVVTGNWKFEGEYEDSVWVE